MTYCIGWRNHNTVYLISDTASTIEDKSGKYKPQKEISSMGEKSFATKTLAVEEYLHKQFRIENNFIIAYAGDVDTALTIIYTTKKYFDPEHPLKSFELALDSIR